MSSKQPVLFTPGPVRIPPLVARYLAEPPCNYHRQDAFRAMFAETEADLKTLVGLREPAAWHATTFTSTGTGTNEACLETFGALGKGLILNNGFFAARLVSQAKQNGLDHEVLSSPVDRPLDPDALDAALRAQPSIKWVYFVSHETRTGLKNPHVELGQVCKRRGVLVGADIVSSAYAYPLDLEAAQLDLAVASSAKAIMSVPGLGIVFVRRSSVPALSAARPRNYYFDVVAEMEKQDKGHETRFAQPVALHAGLRAACIHMKQVGIDNHMRRIQSQMAEIAAALERIGIHAQMEPAYRSNIAVNFGLPPGIQYPEFAREMLARGYYLLYGIPGDSSHFQVSTIGDLSQEHVDGLKGALTEVLARKAA